MYGWERDALGIDTLGEIRGSVSVGMTLDAAASDRAAWWIATLFGPDFWTHWRVGLLRPTLLGKADQPIAPPEPMIMSLPRFVGKKVADIGDHMGFIAVCPAIIEERSLAFGVVGTTKEEAAQRRVEPRERWALVAPSDIAGRLRLTPEAHVRVRLLPSSYRADPTHG